jgi:hypothetical protein
MKWIEMGARFSVMADTDWWHFLRYGRHWPSHERAWWWYCHVTDPLERLWWAIRPNEPRCQDCGRPTKRWWVRNDDHPDCLPF